VGQLQEASETLLFPTVGLGQSLFCLDNGGGSKASLRWFSVLNVGQRGCTFIGDELDVRHKVSSIHIHLILIPLTEDSCLI
jgi:hypothetical protein